MRRVPPFLREARGMGRIAAGLVRGLVARARRQLDPSHPESWEFRGFSQGREDGIVEYLADRMRTPDRFCVEIGSGYGIDGNVAWLAIARRYGGLLVEADPERLEVSRVLLRHVAGRLRFRAERVTAESVPSLAAALPGRAPDVVSIDVDGIDLHLARALLRSGVRPKVLAVEYNSVFGPDLARSVPYRPDLDFRAAHASGLYYGASIAAWRRALGREGYRFVTVESGGVNAFFADPEAFDPAFLERIRPVPFRENFELVRDGRGGQAELARLGGLPLEEVD